jgi:glycerophosphoryl diester phosphodiesterase
MRKTLIIAHRGAPAFARENTIESFQKAVELGADMIEFDVRRTKDHVLIAHHDELMEGKPIRDLAYEEIRKIALHQGFSLTTLEEVLQCTKEQIKLDVELKEEGYEKDVVDLLSRYFQKDQFVVTSFQDSCVRRIKENDPEIKAGLILGISRPRNLISTRLSEFFPIRRWKEAKADLLVPNWELLKFGFLARMKRRNIPVFVWTVNDEKMIRKLLHDERVVSIITDRPDLALSLRQKIMGSPPSPSSHRLFF